MTQIGRDMYQHGARFAVRIGSWWVAFDWTGETFRVQTSEAPIETPSLLYAASCARRWGIDRGTSPDAVLLGVVGGLPSGDGRSILVSAGATCTGRG